MSATPSRSDILENLLFAGILFVVVGTVLYNVAILVAYQALYTSVLITIVTVRLSIYRSQIWRRMHENDTFQ